MKFRKKPVVIHAVQFDGNNHAEVVEFSMANVSHSEQDGSLTIETLEGTLTVSPGDWVIKGVKGEHYPCKPDIFEQTYQPADLSMNFGQAIEALKNGNKVCRAGWNGKGMWIVLMPALSLPPHSSQEPGAKVNDRTAKHIGEDTPLDSQPYIAMWTAQGQWQPGWLASQADMLAEDWQIAD